MGKKRVLNVGGHHRSIGLPHQYDDFDKVLLDIDPSVEPDLVCDARHLTDLRAEQFDAVYCSHNLEHYYRHDVPIVLSGFLHVLKDGGFAQIIVPDIGEVMRAVVAQALDVDDVLYQSSAGPIKVLDVIYGYGAEIERSGEDFFAHKTGFTEKSILMVLRAAGFECLYTTTGRLEINALAFKGVPDQAMRVLWALPAHK